MSDSTAFKNWYNPQSVTVFAGAISNQFPKFDRPLFEKTVLATLEQLEMKDRVKLMATALRDSLGLPYAEATRGFAEMLGDVSDTSETNWADFKVWPLTMYVNLFGVEEPATSLDALYHLTQRFSGEFAIRPLLLNHEALVMERLKTWVTDPSEHVRRLASEGTRPRLPWGQRLQPFVENPVPVLEVLEALKADDSEYVRRSVANNLNDIAKDNPALTIKTCKRWLKECGDIPENHPTYRLVRHALRSLIKAGNSDALEVLGYRPDAPIRLEKYTASETVAMGSALELAFELVSASEITERLVVDFVVHHVKANGKRSPKTFKLKNMVLKPGESKSVKKRHTIKPISTRKYYAGTHAVDIVVNGQTLGTRSFELDLGQ